MIRTMSMNKETVWVIKIGSSLLTDLDSGLNLDSIKAWVDQIKGLMHNDVSVVLVSSGAVSAGMATLKWETRPQQLHQKQAAAAVGQVKLVEVYETLFRQCNLNTALVLLTETDFADRVRYLNSRSTLRTLLELGVIPVINENDTIVNDEIRLGDNDTLAALVCNLLEADKLILLTDQEGLYNANPSDNPDAKLIRNAKAGDKELLDYSGSSGALGSGGMLTKVNAAEKAARSGTQTLICNGNTEDVLTRIWQGEKMGTLLEPVGEPVTARKRWLANRLKVTGSVVLDSGAVESLLSKGTSLLPVGVIQIQGIFERGDLVVCLNQQGEEVARGLVNYNSSNTKKIIRQPSNKIKSILGFQDEPELIHRDNMVLTQE